MALLLYKWLLFFSLPFSFLSMPATDIKKEVHPFYVSVTEIHHNGPEKALEISCRIFIDDMENVLKQNYKTAVDLSSTAQQAQNDKLVADYIPRHLALNADGKALQLSYVGYEKDSESVFCYFEVPNIAAVKNLKLNNSILQDLTPDQINIMHVTVGGTRKSYKLDYPKKEAVFSF
jgi:hypothetical protein